MSERLNNPVSHEVLILGTSELGRSEAVCVNKPETSDHRLSKAEPAVTAHIMLDKVTLG